MVLLILGNGVDMDSDSGTSGSLGQPVPGRSPCQGLSASANGPWLSLVSLTAEAGTGCLPSSRPGPSHVPAAVWPWEQEPKAVHLLGPLLWTEGMSPPCPGVLWEPWEMGGPHLARQVEKVRFREGLRLAQGL